MKVIPTSLQGAVIVEPRVFSDNRGYFTESYTQNKFEVVGVDFQFVQDNESLSTEAGTIRGLHYQLKDMAQTKLVRVTSGAIYDVIVDLRSGSKTYGQWASVILTAYNHRQLLVPKGFAHGFCTLTPNTKVAYKVDNFYSPQHERGIIWNDVDLKIEWPVSNPVLSAKDQIYPTFKEAQIEFAGLAVRAK